MDFQQYGFTEHDIAFMKQKLDEGNLVTVTGSRGTTGELCSITPPTGKIFYHLHSSIMNASSSSAVNVVSAIVSIKNNTTIMDYLGGSEAMHNSYQTSNNVAAKNDKTYSQIPDKLTGDSAKKYSLNVESIANCTIYGTIIGYYEDA